MCRLCVGVVDCLLDLLTSTCTLLYLCYKGGDGKGRGKKREVGKRGAATGSGRGCCAGGLS